MAKILVFTVHSGGGHVSASNALKDYLSDKHDINIVSLFDSVLHKVDPVSTFTARNYTVDNLFNYLFRKKYITIMNTINNAYFYLVPVFKKVCISHIDNFILQHKPDLIISVVPMVNSAIQEVAHNRKIPFLLIPADLDTTLYTAGFENKKYDNKFSCAIPLNHPKVIENMKKSPIASKHLKHIGFPLRKIFFHEKPDAKKIKEKLNIPNSKKVILLMTGSIGQDIAIHYLKEIIKIDFDIHVIICCGRNIELKKEIENFNLPPHITTTIFGFYTHIIDLITISDLIISKPGPSSICEALHLKKPVLLDGVSKTVMWEQFNLEFIKNNQLGTIIANFDELNGLIKKYLTDQKQRAILSKNMEKLKPFTFPQTLNLVVNKMLQKQ